jgi:hypothetical protein
MLVLEQAVYLCQGKDAPCSGATKGTLPSCPQRFFEFSQKNSYNFVETDHMSERFFGWKLELEKSEDDSLHEMASRLFVQSS